MPSLALALIKIPSAGTENRVKRLVAETSEISVFLW
jgi:hypothetical protein